MSEAPLYLIWAVTLSTECSTISNGVKFHGRWGGRCRLLIVPLFRGSSRSESLILSHHARFTCECNKQDIGDDLMIITT